MLDTRSVLALSRAPRFRTVDLWSLHDAHLDFEAITGSNPSILQRHGLRAQTIEALSSPLPYLEQADRELAIAEDQAARIISILDDDYPELLRETYSAPLVIYVRGKIIHDEENLAIVGTRSATRYGKEAAASYAREFAASGVAVTSGLARGIDTAAHHAALDAGGRTIAVVACGLDSIQPYTGARMASSISEQGAVVTEHGFGVKAMPSFFPRRNRIISGMSRATLLVESDVKGGGMITARFALDQNREVYAVPGPIGSPKSAGTNALIRSSRARLTQSPRDLLEDLGIVIEQSERSAPPKEQLTLQEQRLAEHLGPEPKSVDRLAEEAGLPVSEVLVALLGLEFKGAARQLAGQLFARS